MQVRALFAGLAAAALLALPVAAQASETGVAALRQALQLDRLVEVMAAEGRKYGAELAGELFPGRGGARWEAIVAAIHEPERMRGRLAEAMDANLADQPATVAAATAFFSAPLGQRIIALEIGAREALLDPAVEEAAELGLEDLRVTNPARVALIERFVAVNDLVESNVAGALNANLAFFRGMAAGGALDPALNERDMLADLWAQEPQVRADTEAWIFPYLALAYGPLSDADLEAYVAFSMTPEGQALNRALFASFDALFVQVSRELGEAAGRFVQGQDL
jgi:hypothetical protein